MFGGGNIRLTPTIKLFSGSPGSGRRITGLILKVLASVDREGNAVRLDLPQEASELIGDLGIVDPALPGTEHVYTHPAVSRIISIHRERFNTAQDFTPLGASITKGQH